MLDRRTIAAAVLIGVCCFLAFAPAWNAGVTNWDDNVYLNAAGAKSVSSRTFTSFVAGNYHPLTILTLAVEQQLFGRNVRAMHMTNVALHAMTSGLVVVLIALLTQSTLAAVAGGLFFAIHPLRVESVLWISERKDVLFAVFFVAALVAYVAGTRGSRRATRLVWLFFILSLLSKAMAVSLPLALLAIDYLEERLSWRAVWVKLPYFAVSGVFGLLAIYVQRTAGAVSRYHFAVFDRVALCCSAVVLYLGKLFVPVGLSAIYPYPNRVGAAEFAAIASVLAIALLAAWTAKVTRVIIFALAFFVATIALTLPIVGLGGTIAADRYTYIPAVGMAVAVGTGVRLLVRRWRASAALVALYGALLLAATFARAQVWHDSISLWTSVIDRDPSLADAWNSRGAAFAEARRDAAAYADLSRALALRPCHEKALVNRSVILARNGRRDLAERDRLALARCNPHLQKR